MEKEEEEEVEDEEKKEKEKKESAVLLTPCPWLTWWVSIKDLQVDAIVMRY